MVAVSESQTFIDALRSKQASLGLSGNEFARTFGVSPAQYSRVMNGGRGVSLQFAQKAVRAYPDLLRYALSFFDGK